MRIWTLATLVLIFGSSGTARALPDLDRAIEANRALLRAMVAKTGIPGLAVAVAVDDEIIWSEGFGYADLELEVPITPESRFRIASVSKLLTGTCVAKLAELGELDLEQPVTTYVDSLPEAWHAITPWQLAEHTSGIGHYESAEDALNHHFYESTREALTHFSDRPLRHEPGQQKTYSSYAYTLLAAVIEGVTGRTYLDSMHELVFQPLGMGDTVPDIGWQIIPRRTAYYEFDDGHQLRNARFVDLSNRWAGSGYLSTAEDLVRFGAAHTRPGFLNEESLQRIATPRSTTDGEALDESLGWAVRTGWSGRQTLWGDGSTPGTRCGLLVYPEQRLSIALLANARGAPVERGEFQALALRFLAALDGHAVDTPKATDVGRFDLTLHVSGNAIPASLTIEAHGNTFAGTFDFGGYQQFDVADVVRVDDSLWVLCVGEGTGLLKVGIVPLRLSITDDELLGSILRTDVTIEGGRGR